MSKDSSTLNAKQLREHAAKAREEAKKLRDQSRIFRNKEPKDANHAAVGIVRESTPD